MKTGLPIQGRFGDFGGRYIPETLVPAIEEQIGRASCRERV